MKETDILLFKETDIFHYNLQESKVRSSNTRPPRSTAVSQQPYQEDRHEGGLGVRTGLLRRLVLPSEMMGIHHTASLEVAGVEKSTVSPICSSFARNGRNSSIGKAAAYASILLPALLPEVLEECPNFN